MGIFNKYTILAAAAALALSTAPASAADLGGDCCADLEERVAELEATTARKGNRKVSLQISGWVNEAIMIWDDGVDSDAYLASNSTAASRFRFKGSAKIDSSWSAGYYIEIEVAPHRTLGLTQGNDDGGQAFRIRQSNLYIKNEQLGSIRVGMGSPSTNLLPFFGYVSGTAGAFQPDWHSGFSMVLQGSGGLTVSDLAGCSSQGIFFDCTNRLNVIRYDSPTFGGFTVSAAWGEDDFWDVALRYAGQLGDFTVKAGIGYYEIDGADFAGFAPNITAEESIVATAGIIHNPTGIFVQGAYRSFEYPGAAGQPDADGYQIQAGIKQKWNSWGATAIYGAYTQIDDGTFRSVTAAGELDADDTTEINRWSVGLHQWVDAAALELYAIYDHTEAEINGVDTEDLDIVTIGARIKF